MIKLCFQVKQGKYNILLGTHYRLKLSGLNSHKTVLIYELCHVSVG